MSKPMHAFLKTALAALAMSALAFLPSALAENLPEPEGRVILTVSGNIGKTTDGSVARFDREQLENLGVSTVRTDTPWYDDTVTFEGVLAEKLLDHVGATGQVVVATALNQYQAEIPLSDFLKKGVLLALKADGDYLAIRDKGPIFIIYPFDSDSSLRNETHFARSVWQVKELKIK